MRIALGQLWQETNTFNPWPTTRGDFESFGICQGQELVEKMAQTNELGGFIQSLRAWPEKPEIVGLVRLPAWPGGTATADTFAWIKQTFQEALQKSLPVDGVLLALHGALVAENEADVEGAILHMVREMIGGRVPLVATLDLHANVTRKMVEHADALVLYHTAPHIDVFETGQRGAGVLRRILVDGARPVTAFQKIPMVVPAERANTQNPASVSYGFKQALVKLEQEPAILCAGLATVQPWLDIPELGSAVVVVACEPEALAGVSAASLASASGSQIARCAELADEMWRHRKDYLPELTPLDDAVRQAHAIQDGLVVLSDSADSTTSGAPGDSTWILKEMLHYDWPRPALVTLVSPEAVRKAHELGEGAEISLTLGGARDHRFSRPLAFRGTVARLFEAKFILSGHLAKNMPIDMGPCAVLLHKNVHVVVTSRSGPHFAPELFQAAGLDPFAASVLVAKSPCGFRAAYEARARKIILVRAPGCAPSDFWKYEYRKIDRPLWPWDETLKWQAAPILVPGTPK